MLKKALLLFILPLLSAVYSGELFDRGGKTLDFGKYPQGAADGQKMGENLILNGDFETEKEYQIKDISSGKKTLYAVGKFWQHANQVWPSKPAVQKNILNSMISRVETEQKNGNRIFILDNKPEIARFLEKSGKPSFCSKLVQKVSLVPGKKPELYHFSVKVKGGWEDIRNNKALIFFCRFYNSSGKKMTVTGLRLMQRFTMVPDKWQTFNCQVTVPPGTDLCSLSLALYGIGKLHLDELRFQKILEKDASVKLYPMYRFDNTVWLAAGQVNAVKFGMKNQRWQKQDNLRLHLILPDGIEAAGCSGAGQLLKTVKQKNRQTEYIYDVSRCGISRNNYFSASPNVLLKARKNSIGKELSASCFLSKDNDRGSITQFKIKVVPEFIARTPEIFKTGISDQNFDLNFRQKEAELFSRFYRNTGMNMIQGSADVSTLRNELHKQTGMPRAAIRYWLANGYRIGLRGYMFAPEPIAFRGIDGKVLQGYVCPAAVYKRDKVLLQRLLPQIEGFLRHHEFLMPNWEPFVVNGLGCFCSRCRDEFIAYCRKNGNSPTAGEISASWPKTVLIRYKDQWIRFRSKQHGALMKTLEELFVSVGRKLGKKAHLMPEFELFYTTEHGNYAAAQYNPLDFISELEWVALWGPYLYTHPNQIYQYYPGMNIVYLHACESVFDFLAKKMPGKKVPNLLAMPGGGEGGALSEPEALAMDILSAFAAGWQGAMPWTFPFGCDYRWWRAMAKANDAIARNEDVVRGGQKAPGIADVIPRTKLPRTFIPTDWREVNVNFQKEYPGVVGKSILQCRTFRKGNVIVAAVGNFWSRGECFFDLKLKNLPDGKYAVSDQDDLSYGVFTSSQLRKGITLHAGGLRWKFFRIEKDGSGGKTTVSQQKITALMNNRKKAIAALAAEDDALSESLEKKNKKSFIRNDLSSVKPIRNGKILLRNEKSALRILTPSYSVLLSPDDSGTLIECIAGKSVLVKRGEGHFGEDGFWGPRPATLRINGIYKLKSCRSAGKTIEVLLEKTIRENKALSGLLLQKKYCFEENALRIETLVVNQSEKTVPFHFRFHNAPEILRGEGGIYQIGNKTFMRTFNVNMYRFALPDKEVDSLIGSGKIHDILPGSIRLYMGNSSAVWQMDFECRKMQAAVFWDSIKGSSAEIIFKRSLLAPGKSELFSVTLRPVKTEVRSAAKKL